MSGHDAVDLFGGPGGWALALRWHGLTEIGVEWDGYACQTRHAAGFDTIHADVLEVKPADVGPVNGVIGSPPCPLFSAAGTRLGVDQLPWIAALVPQMLDGRPIDLDLIDELAHRIGFDGDTDGVLPGFEPPGLLEARATARELLCALAPAVWCHELAPEWVALEQVPAVLPVWDQYAGALESYGYSTWCGVLNAVDYGVPQKRRRAILIASRVREVGQPPETHAEGGAGGLEPWVSMANALGWSPTNLVGFPRRADDGEAVTIDGEDYRARDLFPADGPSPTLTEKGRSWTVQALEAPATTVMGDPRLWPPGHKVNADDVRRLGEEEAAARYGDRAGTEAIRLEVWQALVLQSFPRDYPLRGNRTARFGQIGDAVPPRLAAHVIGEATGRAVSWW